MTPLDRPHDVEALRQQVEGAGPSLALVTGPRGVGKTVLAHQATPEVDGVRYRAMSLPDPDHRALLTARVRTWRATFEPTPEPAPHAAPAAEPWDALFDEVVDAVGKHRRPFLLLVDDAHRLVEARSRWAEHLAHLWGRARAHALPVHVVLCGEREPLVDALGAPEPSLLDAVTLHLHLEPLPYRAVTRLVARWAPADRIRAWSVFGGLPSRLARLDPSVGLATNVQRLVLERDAPLRLEEEKALAVETQSPARYASILRSMAGGGREWGEILAGAPDFDSGAKMAPYLARLEAAGRVRAERSLDAAPRSRSRRYFIDDPFTAFWYRLVLPWLAETGEGRSAEVWSRHVRPGLEDHLASVLPRACRQWLLLHGNERLPAAAREAGALWGQGYDLPVAGTLHNGQAFYGHVTASPDPPDEGVVDRVAREIRETRYGFGREARHRLVFSHAPPAPDLVRRMARDPLVHAIHLGDLLGDDP